MLHIIAAFVLFRLKKSCFMGKTCMVTTRHHLGTWRVCSGIRAEEGHAAAVVDETGRQTPDRAINVICEARAVSPITTLNTPLPSGHGMCEPTPVIPLLTSLFQPSLSVRCVCWTAWSNEPATTSSMSLVPSSADLDTYCSQQLQPLILFNTVPANIVVPVQKWSPSLLPTSVGNGFGDNNAQSDNRCVDPKGGQYEKLSKRVRWTPKKVVPQEVDQRMRRKKRKKNCSSVTSIHLPDDWSWWTKRSAAKASNF